MQTNNMQMIVFITAKISIYAEDKSK